MSKTKGGTAYNDYRPIGRSDYGVRVARKGYDASTCADSDLLFNSGWRIIQIVKVISEENKRIHIDETRDLPSTCIKRAERIDGVYDWNCAVDEKWFYLPLVRYEYEDTATGRWYFPKKRYKIYHGLGYIPLFFKSKYCADVPGYYLLTNIDIRQDVDYPYTDAPSYYYGNTSDYGIKSKSYTRKKIPGQGETRGCGINTSIQSKMVMAIKTEKSKTKDKSTGPGGIEYETNCPSWAIPPDSNAQTTSLKDYEAFGFFKYDYDNFFEPAENAPLMEYPVGWSGYGGDGDTYTLVDQSGAATVDTKKSLVILRSPMVAPDIEEFTIQ